MILWVRFRNGTAVLYGPSQVVALRCLQGLRPSQGYNEVTHTHTRTCTCACAHTHSWQLLKFPGYWLGTQLGWPQAPTWLLQHGGPKQSDFCGVAGTGFSRVSIVRELGGSFIAFSGLAAEGLLHHFHCNLLLITESLRWAQVQGEGTQTPTLW